MKYHASWSYLPLRKWVEGPIPYWLHILILESISRYYLLYTNANLGAAIIYCTDFTHISESCILWFVFVFDMTMAWLRLRHCHWLRFRFLGSNDIQRRHNLVEFILRPGPILKHPKREVVAPAGPQILAKLQGQRAEPQSLERCGVIWKNKFALWVLLQSS